MERPQAVADHLRDRDRLAERAAEPEHDRGDDAALHVAGRRRRAPSPSASRRAPSEASLTSRGTLRKSSRQIDDVIGMAIIVSTTIADENARLGRRAAEERDPAEAVVQERLDVGAHERRRARRCPRGR